MASTRLGYWLSCVALLIGLCCVAPAAMAAPAANLRVAKVTALSGEVKVKKAGGEKSLAAFKNMGLTEGDTIITGKAASLTLELDEYEEVRIGENSHVLISELRVALDENSEQTTFNLLAGGLWSNIRKQLNLDSRYQIKTANAVMGVRGTMFYVGQNSEGATTIAVLDGTVGATSNGQQEIPPAMIEAGRQLRLDEPPEDIVDFIVEELSPAGLDSFALQIIEELSVNRPDLVSPALAEQVREIIERRQQEQPTSPLQAPPSVQIIYDPSVVPQQEEQDALPQQLPAISLDPIGNQVVAVNGAFFVSPIVSPFDASILAIASNSAGLEIITENSGSTPLLRITGKQVGMYTVTVTASRSGHTSDSKTFTVRVVNAPTITGLEIAGDPYVGEEVWVSYQYSDADEDAENGTTYQWQRAATADAPDSGWSAIPGATRDGYVPTEEDDQGKWLRCVVTPKDGIVFGAPVTSLAKGPIGQERPAVEFPTIEDVTVFEGGHVMIPLPVSPGYLQDPHSYAPGDFAGFTSNKDVASISVYSRGGRCLLGVDGCAAGETEASIVVSGPEHKTIRLSFPVTVIERVSGEIYPEAQDPVIQGSLEAGSELSAGYRFVDSVGHDEGNSYFDWRISSSQDDSEGEHIPGAIERTYTLTEDDLGKYIILHIYPCDQYGKWGENMWHAGPMGPILPRNTAPQVSDVRLTGVPRVGETLTLTYTFADEDDDLEGESHIQWYRGVGADDPEKSAIADANGSSYTVVDADEGFRIWVVVNSKDEHGKTGQAVVSNPLGPAIAADQLWLPVGDTSALNWALGDSYSCLSAKSDGENIYVAYLGADGEAHVWQWNGGSWSELAAASPYGAGILQLDVDDGIPYIAYAYSFNTGQSGIYVRRYQGDQWETVGGERVFYPQDSGVISSLMNGQLALDVEDGVPYVAVCQPAEGALAGWPRRPTVYRCADGIWLPLGLVGLIATPDRAAGIDIAVSDGIPYVAYRRQSEYDPIYVFQYGGLGWTSLASYDSETEDQSEIFELQWAGDELYLMTSFFGHIGPRLLRYDGSSEEFQLIGSEDFAEEVVSRPKLAVLNGQPFVVYQSDQVASVQRLNDGVWTHFGGLGIPGGLTPSLAIVGNTAYLAYVDAEDAVRVVSTQMGAGTVQALATVSAPTWDVTNPAAIEWAAVPNAVGYRLQVHKGASLIKTVTVNKDTTGYDLGALIRDHGEGEYRVQVRALGDGLTFADGQYSASSIARTAPILLSDVESASWGEGAIVTWDSVAQAAGYRLTLYRHAWTENEPRACYQLDVDSGVTSFDFGQILDLADQRIHDQEWNHNPSGSAGYQVSVTGLGSGIYGNSSTSPMTQYLWRDAVPWVTNITLTDVADSGDASDFRIGFETPEDESDVAEYQVILVGGNSSPSLGELAALPSSRYHAIAPEASLPAALPAALLDFDGNSLEIGKSYAAYVLTVPTSEASIYAYTEATDRTELACPGLRMVRADGEYGVQLEFSQELSSSLNLTTGDFAVTPVINGARGSDCTITSLYVSGRYVNLYSDDYLDVGEGPVAYYLEVRLNEAARERITAAGGAPTLTGGLTWRTRAVDHYPPAVTTVEVSQNLNQVLLQFGDTPQGDRFDLQFKGESTTRLLRFLDVSEWMTDGDAEEASPLLAGHYTSDGQLTLHLRDADTANYGQLILPLWIYDKLIYNPSSPGFRLRLTDQGSTWMAEVLMPEPEA